ncbi:nucleoside monophosphate kinase [Nocardia sp. IBHARD005]|uniref:nucleoside monophosphate kinase n=1 Tax=Nocardia sp. IBHARD005 TaxID=3457765 RepID=UPI00405A3923
MRISVLGVGGSSVESVVEWARAELSIPVYTAAKLLRPSIVNETELGRRARSFLDAGERIPDHLVTSIASAELVDLRSGGYLLLGLPATVGLRVALDAVGVAIDHALIVDMSEDALIAKVAAELEPDRCHEFWWRALSRRFNDEVQPLRDWYQQRAAEGALEFAVVNGEGAAAEVVDRAKRALGIAL